MEAEDEEVEEAAPLIELLLLEVDGQQVALPLSAVIEVLPCATVDPSAGAPDFVEGFLNVRGTVLPVISLRERLGRTPRAPHVDDHLVRVETSTREVMVRADRALDLIGVDPHKLQPLDEPHGPFTGAVATDSGVLLVQDPEAFLSQAEADALAAP